MSSPAMITTGVVASLGIIVLAVVAKVPTYRAAPLFLLPIMWALYWLRRRIDLHPLHYALFCSALVLHGLGALGLYQRGVFGISFDIIVHYWFGLVGALIVQRAIANRLSFGAMASWVGAVLLVMGCGAIHEIVEYASSLVLGEQRGMLKPSTSYFFDTQRDLLNNLLGAVTAIIAGTVLNAFGAGRSATHPKPPFSSK